MEVSSLFLSERYQVAKRTIRDWANRGNIKRVGKDLYELASSDLFFIGKLQDELVSLQKSGSAEDSQVRLILAQCRKIEAEAGIKELDLEERKGELILLAEAIAEIKDAFARIKSKLTALPARLALELSGMDDPKDISGLLESVIDESLQELSAEFLGEDGG